MTGFDFVFALFSLVLGLAVAEVLGGFARVMRLHARARAGLGQDVRVGWLTPLLAVLVTLNQLSFWMYGFAVRETLPFGYLTLLGVLVIVGAYYLFSSLVFPEAPEDWPDFDLYYDQHNRFILGGMSIINLIVQVILPAFSSASRAAQLRAMDAATSPLVWAAILASMVFLVLMPVLIWVRGRRLNAVLLVVLIALDIGMAVLLALAGLKPV